MQDFSFAIKMVGPEPDNGRTIFHVAQGFYLAGNRAALNIEVGPNLTQSLVSASVVNHCFALELFFKALIRNAGAKPPHTHKLLELFNLLSDDSKKEIQESFEGIIQSPKFEVFINEISDYFQKVRYEYDYPIEIYYDGPIAQFSKAVYVYTARIFEMKSNLSQIVT